MVVAPFNAQVRLLRERLPAAVEVGTVDKFQGRQAVAVFYSMASSSGEDVPRGLGFLLSRNRLNVAVSRAQMPRLRRLLAAFARSRLPHRGAPEARERALPLRRDGDAHACVGRHPRFACRRSRRWSCCLP
jgi:hypothetical protein